MPIITFDEETKKKKPGIVTFEEEVEPTKEVVTFEDVPKKALPKKIVTFEEVKTKPPPVEMTMEEKAKKYGEIKAYSFPKHIKNVVRRKTDVATKALVGDIPYVRK